LSNIQKTDQALPKVPRVKSDGSGYDWREFDRWIQTIQRLLGAFADGQKAVNLFTGHMDNQTAIHVLTSGVGSVSTKNPTNDDTDFLTLYWVGV
jgi:hypothetical protein